MTRASKSKLLADRDALRRRLAEAEEVLDAIRNGEVDAVVVHGERGPQVYTLEGADRVYRQLIESMSEGAVTLSPAGVVLYCNKQFAHMIGHPIEQIVGNLLRDHVFAQYRTAIESAIMQASTEPAHVDVDLLGTGGRALPARISTARLFGGQEEAIFCVIVTDISEQKQRLAEVASAERLARSILRQAAEAIIVCDANGMVERISDSAQVLCDDNACGRAFAKAFPLRIDSAGWFDLAPALRGETLRHVDVTFEAAGCHRNFILNAAPLLEDARLIGCVVSLTDITERVEAARQIRYLNRAYAMQSSINMLIVHAHDRDYLYRETSRIACEVGDFSAALVCSRDTVLGKLAPRASAGKDKEFLSALSTQVTGGDDGLAMLCARAAADGKIVAIDDLERSTSPQFAQLCTRAGIAAMALLPFVVNAQCVGIALFLADNREAFVQREEIKVLAEIASDIGFSLDHIEKEQRLSYLAYYDELTGLANRTLFLERVAQFLRSAEKSQDKVAVCAINLERFKNLNDSYGWKAGDALLRQVAGWLEGEVRDAGLLARFGSDRFAVVLPQAGHGEGAARFAEHMTGAFSQHAFRLDSTPVRLGAKVGVALYPDDGADAETLFRHAEAALNLAKAGTARYLFYTQRMTEEIASEMALENQLRTAYGHGEFVLYYQPKLDIASGRTDSAEALLRWRSPDLGLVPPARFIPMLEESSLIHEVGRWVVQQVVADQERWRAAGLRPMRVAANLSTLQLQHPRFIENFRDDLSAMRTASGMEIEVTESAIMANPAESIENLRAIRARGVRIAIDDFGTGYSSLNYLLKLPADTLKIDRSFIVDMTTKPESLALVSTIIDLAHSLNLKVVAEGVETDEQLNLLRLLRCDEIQGYYLSAPIPREEFEKSYLAPKVA
ncbi:MAG: EAL domain-containing protein [Bacillota bacterium]